MLPRRVIPHTIQLFENNLTMNCGGASVPPDSSLMKGGEGGDQWKKASVNPEGRKKVRLRKR